MSGEPKKPNIILITTDQQRYDTLGIAGNERIKTPNIDALAAGGVNFSRGFIQNTVCVPSRACIQTGRYTHQHGVTYMETAVDDTPGLPDWELTFMQHLQQHGYRTGATGKIHMYPEKGFHWHMLTGGKGQRWLVPEGSPLGPGPLGPKYAAWLDARRPGAYEQLYAERRAQPSYKLSGVMDIPLSSEEYIEHWIREQSLEFIENQAAGDEPFFLWCGFCGPHGPFDPPLPYRLMYPVADVPLPIELEGWPTWREKWDEALIRRAVSYYWAMVSCIDDHVGRIVETLKRKSILDDTLIIYTTDHGEMLGERGRMGKSVFYDSVTHVPLIVKPPSGCPCKRGQNAQLTEVMNIAPTVLDYAGIAIPESMTAHSLRPLLEGKTDGTEAVFCEYVANDRREYGKCVRTATHKYIKWYAGGREEFFDLESDPLEQDNLASDGAQRGTMLALKDGLTDWLARTEWRHVYRASAG